MATELKAYSVIVKRRQNVRDALRVGGLSVTSGLLIILLFIQGISQLQ